MIIKAYRVEHDAPPIVPARPMREWMNGTPDRFAYRCLPLSMANSSGWQIDLPFDVDVEWDGTDHPRGMKIRSIDRRVKTRIASHFGSGVLTFHPGYLFRTPPGWAMWARGAPNFFIDGIVPLDGLVETAWAPMTFTMNWRFVKPGAVRFKKGDPYCFVTPVPHQQLDAIELEIDEIMSDKELCEPYLKWGKRRAEFNKKLGEGCPHAIKQAWMKEYTRGEVPDVTTGYHITARTMKVRDGRSGR